MPSKKQTTKATEETNEIVVIDYESTSPEIQQMVALTHAFVKSLKMENEVINEQRGDIINLFQQAINLVGQFGKLEAQYSGRLQELTENLINVQKKGNVVEISFDEEEIEKIMGAPKSEGQQGPHNALDYLYGKTAYYIGKSMQNTVYEQWHLNSVGNQIFALLLEFFGYASTNIVTDAGKS